MHDRVYTIGPISGGDPALVYLTDETNTVYGCAYAADQKDVDGLTQFKDDLIEFAP